MFFVANLHEGPDMLSQVWPSEVSLKQSGVVEHTIDTFQREHAVSLSDLLRSCKDCLAWTAREKQVQLSL